MKLEVIDQIKCPLCISEGLEMNRKFSLTGDYNDSRIVDGFVQCNNGHKWQVRDELYRLMTPIEDDSELYDPIIPPAEEPIIPEGMSKSDLPMLRVAMSTALTKLATDKTLVLIGNSIEFLKKIDKPTTNIIVVDSDESILRKAQEISAMNGYYDNMTFVVQDSIDFHDRENYLIVSFFRHIVNTDKQILLNKSNGGTVLGKLGNRFIVLL